MQANGFVDQNGRILIPAPMRKKLNLHTGDRMVLRIIDNELHLISIDKVINDTQILFKKLITSNTSDVDEFIEGRRKEALSENSKFNGNELQ